MRRAIFAPNARADLRKIVAYMNTYDADAADRFIDAVKVTADKVALAPHHYSPRDDIEPGIRTARHRRHLLYFEPTDFGILVLRVLHERQDAYRAFDS